MLRAASNAHARIPAAAARHISNTKTPTHKHHRRAQSASQPRQAQLPPQRTTPNTAQPTCTWPHSLQPATLPCCCMNGWALLYDQVPQAQHSTAPHRIDNTSSHGHAELCTAAHPCHEIKHITAESEQTRTNSLPRLHKHARTHSLQPASLPCCCVDGWVLLYDQVPQAQVGVLAHAAQPVEALLHLAACSKREQHKCCLRAIAHNQLTRQPASVHHTTGVKSASVVTRKSLMLKQCCLLQPPHQTGHCCCCCCVGCSQPQLLRRACHQCLTWPAAAAGCAQPGVKSHPAHPACMALAKRHNLKQQHQHSHRHFYGVTSNVPAIRQCRAARTTTTCSCSPVYKQLEGWQGCALASSASQRLVNDDAMQRYLRGECH